MRLHLLAQPVVLLNRFADNGGQVLGSGKEGFQVVQDVFLNVHSFFGSLARDGFDAAHAGCHTALRNDAEKPDAPCAVGVATAAELHALAKLYHTHTVAVFLAEQGDGSQFLGLLHGHIAVILQRNVLADAAVHDAFHLSQLLGRHLLEVGEVKAQVVRCHQRTFLFHVRSQYFAQSLVEQVRGRMVGLASPAGFQVHLGTEGCFGMSRQFLGEMNGQVVLPFRVENLHLLLVVDQYAAVAHLATHLSVERRFVEHQFVEHLFLLLHAAVAQDMAVAFREIPAFELRFSLFQHHPVVRFNGCGVPGALLLLLHFGIKLLFVHRQPVLLANQLREV